MKRGQSHIGSFFIAAMMGLITLMLPYASNAQNFSDAEIKAVYIFKLGKFVLWDGKRRSPIEVCAMESAKLADDESVGKTLDKFVRSKGLGGEWQVKRIRNLDGVDDCDILYVGSSEESAVASITSRVDSKDILTISDIKRFIYKDGMIGFVLDDQNRVKMEANLKNIRKTKVQVSAQVLEFMTQVIK